MFCHETCFDVFCCCFWSSLFFSFSQGKAREGSRREQDVPSHVLLLRDIQRGLKRCSTVSTLVVALPTPTDHTNMFDYYSSVQGLSPLVTKTCFPVKSTCVENARPYCAVEKAVLLPWEISTRPFPTPQHCVSSESSAGFEKFVQQVKLKNRSKRETELVENKCVYLLVSSQFYLSVY